MKRELAFAFATAAILAGAPAVAASIINFDKVTLRADPAYYNGSCPAVITFKGGIKVNGEFDPKDPVNVAYQFERSDGATGQVIYFMPSHKDIYPVSTSWRLGSIGVNHSAVGWVRVKVWR